MRVPRQGAAPRSGFGDDADGATLGRTLGGEGDLAVDQGFLRAEYRAMALAETDIERLLDAMAAYRPEPVSKWLKDTQQL